MQADGRRARPGVEPSRTAAQGRKRAALRNVLRELTKQQGFMLAHSVEKIPRVTATTRSGGWGGAEEWWCWWWWWS
jgi:hypothetical protein